MEIIKNYISLQNICLYLLLINLIGFIIMYIDKRKAQKQTWRIPEKTLLYITLLGGGIGSIIGMYTFRHKTQKVKFLLGFPIITIIEIIFLIYFIWKVYFV